MTSFTQLVASVSDFYRNDHRVSIILCCSFANHASDLIVQHEQKIKSQNLLPSWNQAECKLLFARSREIAKKQLRCSAIWSVCISVLRFWAARQHSDCRTLPRRQYSRPQEYPSESVNIIVSEWKWTAQRWRNRPDRCHSSYWGDSDRIRKLAYDREHSVFWPRWNV